MLLNKAFTKSGKSHDMYSENCKNSHVKQYLIAKSKARTDTLLSKDDF